ncbi:PREDICTED: uncharacterized protein LOC106807879 [Priapulus caudatus]|uniref:Uncharacterized protein LOC106807879 n=1 Tax=Priapulus caudatus TaxID=37621 RepID=A0ABM1E0Y6_PRICU|nr:PREDICTED: uncharacterized protein LOC106807879 [Priapulus caudatus]
MKIRSFTMHSKLVGDIVALLLLAVATLANNRLPGIQYLQETPTDITLTWTQSDRQVASLELEYRSVQPGAETELVKTPLEPSQSAYVIAGLSPDTWYLVCLGAIASNMEDTRRMCEVKKTMLVNGSLSDTHLFDWETHVYHDRVRVAFYPKADVPYDAMKFTADLYVKTQNPKVLERPTVNWLSDRDIEFSGAGVQPNTEYRLCVGVEAAMSEVADVHTTDERCVPLWTAKTPPPTSPPQPNSAQVFVANMVIFGSVLLLLRVAY